LTELCSPTYHAMQTVCACVRACRNTQGSEAGSFRRKKYEDNPADLCVYLIAYSSLRAKCSVANTKVTNERAHAFMNEYAL